MPNALLSPVARQRFHKPDGTPASGYKLTTYASGTTTPQATYNDRAGTVPNPNPIILDADGYAPAIYLTAGLVYDYKLTSDTGGVQWTQPGVSALASDAGAVAFSRSEAGATERTVNAKLSERVSVEDFGAKGDATTDDSTAFEDAVAALPASGGTIYLNPDGRYKLTRMITYTKPILWACERGHSDVSTNTNGGDAERPVIFYGGSTPIEALLRQRPATTGTALWGGGVDGVTFDGFGLAEYGIHLDNARYARLRGKARNMTKAGALLSSLSGTTTVFSKKCHVQDWEYVYGTLAACKDSHGVRIIGNGSTVPSTQHKIDRVFALVKHGAAVCVEETDNCLIASAQAVGDSGSGGGGGAATGCAVWFRNIGSTVAYNNVVQYAAGGIKLDSGTFGQHFGTVTSEGGGITITSGSANYTVDAIIDYITGQAFRSHLYPLRKSIRLSATEMSGGTPGLLAGKWGGVLMQEASGSTVSAFIRDEDLSTGVIESVVVSLASNSAPAGNYRYVVELSAVPFNDAGPVATPQRSVGATLASFAQYTINQHTFDMASLPFTKGQTLLLNVTRLPADAADSATTDVCVVNVEINFRSSGPTSGGSGSLYIPTW